VTRFILCLASVVIAVCDRPAAAQLPTATGRQIAMSNAAWKIFIPNEYVERPNAAADLLVHFHGDPQTYWNNAKFAKLNAIIVTVNYNGLSSAYQTPFSNSALFQSIVDEALVKVRQQADIPDALQWDKLGVSSFSAGYAAVREILKSAAYRDDVDALLAADSIHASTSSVDQTPLDSQMADFKTFATLAKAGSKTFIVSHSQVPTSGYESTTETANELLQHLGLTAPAINQAGLGTLAYNRHVKSGNFELWGATGTNAAAHSKHLQYIGDFLNDLPLARVPTWTADFSKDGPVDALDLATWRQAFGASGVGDADADGDSDGADFLAWQRQLGSATSAAVAAIVTPEPASAWPMVFAAVSGLQISRRRALGKSRRFPHQRDFLFARLRPDGCFATLTGRSCR
jgi:hypothetical protein